jgi:hypothetical protein
MVTSKRTLSAGLLLAAACFATPALAVVSIASSIAGAPDPALPAGFTKVITFDTASAAGIVNTISGNVRTAAGNQSGRAAPAGTAPGGVYQSVGAGGASTFNFAGYLPPSQVLTGFSVYWGSVDNHNIVDFLRADGSLVSSFTGGNLPRFDGNQTLSATNRRITFAMTDLDRITQIRFRATGTAFEYDTIAVQTGVVPEPASWAMLITGFGLIGSALRRRRHAVAA